MDFKKIREFVESVLPKEKKSHQLTFKDIVAGLNDSGFYAPEWTVCRQLKGLDISKGVDGYYSQADAVLLIGWNSRRDRYGSYKNFYKHEGAQLYKVAQTQFC